MKFIYFFIVLQPCNCIAREKAGNFFIAIVLQEKGNCIAIWGRLARNYIALLVLYCNLGGLKGWKIVLQYRGLYCNEACK